METSRLQQLLGDERCGLYFLAGLDRGKSGSSQRALTLHAANGTLSAESERFIRSGVSELDSKLEVRVRLHSTQALYAPQSLESFARSFKHEAVLVDPTGAFARISQLVELVELVRLKFGSCLDHILWRADECALIFVSKPQKSGSKTNLADTEEFRSKLMAFIADKSHPDLQKALVSTRVLSEVPVGRFTPVDDLSIDRSPIDANLAKKLIRLAGIVAALIGVGSVVPANAALTTDDGYSPTPGIEAISGLTTLGENAYGLRNHFRAIGGLRLYFGDTGILLATAPKSRMREDIFDEDPTPDSFRMREGIAPPPERIISAS